MGIRAASDAEAISPGRSEITEVAMLLAWNMFPMPKEASAVNRA